MVAAGVWPWDPGRLLRLEASSFKLQGSCKHAQKNYSKNAQGPLAQPRSPFESGSPPRILLFPSPKDIRTTSSNLRRGLCSGSDDKIAHFFPELSNVKVLLWDHAPPYIQHPARVVYCVDNQYFLAVYWYSLYLSTTASHSQCHPLKRTVGFPHRCWTETDSGGESW